MSDAIYQSSYKIFCLTVSRKKKGLIQSKQSYRYNFLNCQLSGRKKMPKPTRLQKQQWIEIELNLVIAAFASDDNSLHQELFRTPAGIFIRVCNLTTTQFFRANLTHAHSSLAKKLFSGPCFKQYGEGLLSRARKFRPLVCTASENITCHLQVKRKVWWSLNPSLHLPYGPYWFLTFDGTLSKTAVVC